MSDSVTIPTYRILYTGHPLAGRASSMFSVIARSDRQSPLLAKPYLIGCPGTSVVLRWSTEREAIHLAIAKLTFYETQATATMVELHRSNDVQLELEFLRKADGVIFVASADPTYTEQCSYAWVRLHWIYEQLGLDFSSVPKVVQLNFMDRRNGLTPEDLRSRLYLPQEVPIVPSVAILHRGTVQAVETVLSLIVDPK